MSRVKSIWKTADIVRLNPSGPEHPIFGLAVGATGAAGPVGFDRLTARCFQQLPMQASEGEMRDVEDQNATCVFSNGEWLPVMSAADAPFERPEPKAGRWRGSVLMQTDLPQDAAVGDAVWVEQLTMYVVRNEQGAWATVGSSEESAEREMEAAVLAHLDRQASAGRETEVDGEQLRRAREALEALE